MSIRPTQRLVWEVLQTSKRQTIRSMSSTAETLEKQKLFLSSPQFAVVGASTDQSKYGTKVSPKTDGPFIPDYA